MATTPGGFSPRNQTHISRVTQTKVGHGRSRECQETVILQWKYQTCSHWHDIVPKPGQRSWGFNRVPAERMGEPTRPVSALGRWNNSHFHHGLGVRTHRTPAEKSALSPAIAAQKDAGAAVRQTKLFRKGASRLQPLSLPVGCSRDNTFISPCLARALPLPPYHSTQDH